MSRGAKCVPLQFSLFLGLYPSFFSPRRRRRVSVNKQFFTQYPNKYKLPIILVYKYIYKYK